MLKLHPWIYIYKKKQHAVVLKYSNINFEMLNTRKHFNNNMFCGRNSF